MGHYNNATICLNGHVVSKYQANYQKLVKHGKKITGTERRISTIFLVIIQDIL